MKLNIADAEATGFEVLPKNMYLVVAKSAELKDTRSGDGQYIKVQFEVIDGQHRGRKLWHQFNVKNPNETAVKIGKGQMKKFFLSAGVKQEALADLEESNFVGQTAVASVDIETDSYGERNVIKDFRPERQVTQKPASKEAVTKPGF